MLIALFFAISIASAIAFYKIPNISVRIVAAFSMPLFATCAIDEIINGKTRTEEYAISVKNNNAIIEKQRKIKQKNIEASKTQKAKSAYENLVKNLSEVDGLCVRYDSTPVFGRVFVLSDGEKIIAESDTQTVSMFCNDYILKNQSLSTVRSFFGKNKASFQEQASCEAVVKQSIEVLAWRAKEEKFTCTVDGKFASISKIFYPEFSVEITASGVEVEKGVKFYCNKSLFLNQDSSELTIEENRNQIRDPFSQYKLAND